MSLVLREKKKRVLLARYAMGTRFELALWGGNEVALRAAGEAALDEVETLDERLSLFRRDSFLNYINEHAPRVPVRVDPDLFALLKTCRDVYRASGGAFDPTVVPLMAQQGFYEEENCPPLLGKAPGQWATGFNNIVLEDEEERVRFLCEGLCLDLGGIAKGFALALGVEILRESGMEQVLFHGGTSTVVAIGAPPCESHWTVGIKDPGASDGLLGTVALCDQALSVSAPHGRFVENGGKRKGHLIDPATGAPAGANGLVAVIGDSPILADAWSTALFIGGPGRFASLSGKAAGCTAFFYAPGEETGSALLLGPQKNSFTIFHRKDSTT